MGYAAPTALTATHYDIKCKLSMKKANRSWPGESGMHTYRYISMLDVRELFHAAFKLFTGDCARIAELARFSEFQCLRISFLFG